MKEFIESAKKYARNPDKIICPCAKCKNLSSKNHEDLYQHLVMNGFDPLYTEWVVHGESSSNIQENTCHKTLDAYRMFQDAYVANANCSEYTERSEPYDFTKKFEEAEVPLYSTCTRHKVISDNSFVQL